MSIVTREARPHEIDETARILAAAFEQYRPPADAAVARAYREGFERYLEDVADVRSRLGHAELFVAVEGNRILGTASLYRPSQPVEYPTDTGVPPWPPEWAILRLLGVDPSHRRRGIGRMLTDARMRRARDLGAPVVALHTTFEVARAMYGRLGWRRAPEYDHHPLPEVCAEAYVFALV